MARRRSDFSKLLKDTLPEIKNFYFTPPNGTQMKYPCVVYRRITNRDMKADNKPYVRNRQYMVTFIDNNPDSPYPDRIEDLPYCSKDREFCQDDLYHHVFTIFF